MVVLSAKIKIQAEFKSRFLRAGYAMLPLSRAEPGCIEYNFYQDIHDDFSFHFFEKWSSREALQAHFETAHFKQFMEIVEAMVKDAPAVEIFEVASVETLPAPAAPGPEPAPETPTA